MSAAVQPQQIAEAQRHLAACDPVLAPVIERFGPCGLANRPVDRFHVLAQSIISQHLSTRAADAIRARVETAAACPGRITAEALLGIEADVLRAAGLSNAKARWLRGLAEAHRSGALSLQALDALDDEAAIRLLDALPGVGRWTAEMFLMFALHRLDVFSLGDVGLRRGVDLLYNGGRKTDAATTLAIAARWSPYRTVACWYLWRHTEGNVQAWT
jgi:DNA-3-methyladenine glycosylase II